MTLETLSVGSVKLLQNGLFSVGDFGRNILREETRQFFQCFSPCSLRALRSSLWSLPSFCGSSCGALAGALQGIFLTCCYLAIQSRHTTAFALEVIDHSFRIASVFFL